MSFVMLYFEFTELCTEFVGLLSKNVQGEVSLEELRSKIPVKFPYHCFSNWAVYGDKSGNLFQQRNVALF